VSHIIKLIKNNNLIILFKNHTADFQQFLLYFSTFSADFQQFLLCFSISVRAGYWLLKSIQQHQKIT